MKTTKTHPNGLYLILFFCLALMPQILFAQTRLQEKREQVKSLKVAFITEELQLSTLEAEKFWPLFNAYDSKQQELRHQKLKAYMNRLNNETLDKMNDKEAAAALAQIEGTDEEIYLNRKNFINSLKKVLPPAKIIKLRKTEEDFNRKLLRQYRNKNKN